jgi:hypothetical protein
MPKIPNTTARDSKPHPLRVGTFVAIGPSVGSVEYPFSGKARKKKPTIRKVVTNNENLFLITILHPPSLIITSVIQK